jgi:hypothetical protein
MMAPIVYGLCFLTAAGCAGLLLAAWRRTRVPLLFWSGLCFAGLAINEALVIFDLLIVPEVSYIAWRSVAGLVAVGLMLGGLILGSTGSRP